LKQPSKKKSRERIDGIVALIMGLERARTGEAVTGPLFVWNPEEEYQRHVGVSDRRAPDQAVRLAACHEQQHPL